ncbi:MAG: putative sulfate exporter family transporter [Chloroflexi bacterium]|nr:putative sulfate exporter family transporter [Chloroflexota bacterium]
MTTTTAPSSALPAAQSRLRLGLLAGLVLVAALTLLVAEIDQAIANFFRTQGVTNNPLEYPLTAVLIGLIANGLLRVTGLYNTVKPGVRTELFLKIGLVLLGAKISLGDLMKTGAGGLVQAVIMVISVFFFTWWLAGKLKLSPTLKAVMASAVSVCGVSAAIAAAGSVMAKKEEVTYITALVILTALPLMIVLPVLASAMGLPPTVAGAWFGGNIDTTAAVVGAGTIYGAEAQTVASVVKLSQNVFIGFVAFALALYFALVVEKNAGQKPSPKLIWQRFPKFVIGFVLVSLLVSIGAISAPLAKELDTLTKWAFALAFVCIGIDFAPGAVRQMGWKPVLVYLGATVFNTLLALVVASVIFGTMGLGKV